MKKLCVMFLIIMFTCVGIGLASDENEDKIPNYIQEDTTDTNGRAAHLDTDKEGDQLNPVERAIVLKDGAKSNQLNPNLAE